jgi:hypothetical protein
LSEDKKAVTVKELKPDDVFYVRSSEGAMLREFVVTQIPFNKMHNGREVIALACKPHTEHFAKEKETELLFANGEISVIVTGTRETKTVHAITGKVYYDGRTDLYVGLYETADGEVETRAHISMEEDAIDLPLFYSEDADPPVCDVPPECLKYRRFKLTFEE